jgi:ABC-type dipeptide/oligopeptide/nickel transport system permease subunit
MSQVKRYSQLTLIWRRLSRNRAAVFGVGLILAFSLAAILAPFLMPYDPIQQDLEHSLELPSLNHPLGRDELGRDILTRVIYGTRVSLMIGAVAIAIGLAVGVPLGGISGYYGGKIDFVIQRVVDVMLAFPGILLALALVAILGVGLQNVIVAVGVSSIPIYIRLVRGSALSIRDLEYVQAARALGVREYVILGRHVLLNCSAPIIVQSTLSLGTAILVAAGLGFLGLGVQPPTPEWGAMLGTGRTYLFSAPHVATFPGVAIFLAVLGFNLLGDGLRDALDPRLKIL